MNDLIAVLWRDETPYIFGAMLLLVALLWRFLAGGRATVRHALLFFVCGLVAVLIFSAAALLRPIPAFPRAMALPGLPVIAAFVWFVIEVFSLPDLSIQAFAAPDPAARLAFWPVAAAEWLVALTVLVWITMVSIRQRSLG